VAVAKQTTKSSAADVLSAELFVVQSLSALKESDIGVLVVDVARLLDAPSNSTVSRGADVHKA
jgi:hypothetical protein